MEKTAFAFFDGCAHPLRVAWIEGEAAAVPQKRRAEHPIVLRLVRRCAIKGSKAHGRTSHGMEGYFFHLDLGFASCQR